LTTRSFDSQLSNQKLKICHPTNRQASTWATTVIANWTKQTGPRNLHHPTKQWIQMKRKNLQKLSKILVRGNPFCTWAPHIMTPVSTSCLHSRSSEDTRPNYVFWAFIRLTLPPIQKMQQMQCLRLSTSSSIKLQDADRQFCCTT